ncbi:MAG: biopolymer transporter ExbD [Gemmatimonadetes bacterium]|nr:biopolymer transporter ExbD [Gemmatimonadota bacterium]
MSAIGTRRRGRSRGDLPVSVEINVTSLVDLAFTLLVIFMITAPMMQGGIEVDVPRADVQALSSSDNPFFISVLRDGRIIMEETTVSLEELEAGLPQLLSAGTVERVFIRGDSLAPFGPVLRVMATAVNSAVPWSLVAEPWRGEP